MQKNIDSCAAGAADYAQGIKAAASDVLPKLVSTQLEVVSAKDAYLQTVQDAKTYVKGSLDFSAAAKEPMRWLCGTLVGVLVDRGVGKAFPKAPVATKVEDLVGHVGVDAIEGRYGLWAPNKKAPKFDPFSDHTGQPPMANPPRGFFVDGTLTRNSGLPLFNQKAHFTCGPVSCVMVLETGGRKVDLTAAIKKADAAGGVLPQDIASILTREGIPATVYKGTVAKMRKEKAGKIVPFVAVIRVKGSPNGEFRNGGGLHAVVVDGFTSRYGQDVVAIRNPWGREYFELVSEFEKQFDGVWIRPF